MNIQGTDLQPCVTRKHELSVQVGCVMWGKRLVKTPQGRDKVTNILHDSHAGIVRMKGIARSHVWWPKMDQALEERVKSCKTAQERRKMPATAALHPWEWPSRLWTRMHIDYGGPFMGKMFLIIIDAQSKWLDVHCVNTATTEITIAKLRSTFASHCLLRQQRCVYQARVQDLYPEKRYTPCYLSVLPPATNGLAERAVQGSPSSKE